MVDLLLNVTGFVNTQQHETDLPLIQLIPAFPGIG